MYPFDAKYKFNTLRCKALISSKTKQSPIIITSVSENSVTSTTAQRGLGASERHSSLELTKALPAGHRWVRWFMRQPPRSGALDFYSQTDDQHQRKVGAVRCWKVCIQVSPISGSMWAEFGVPTTKYPAAAPPPCQRGQSRTRKWYSGLHDWYVLFNGVRQKWVDRVPWYTVPHPSSVIVRRLLAMDLQGVRKWSESSRQAHFSIRTFGRAYSICTDTVPETVLRKIEGW